MADVLVGLADAIEAIRAEVARAMSAGADQSMRFRPGFVEVTLRVALIRDAAGEIGWKVIEFSDRPETVTTQSLTLRLIPDWRDTDTADIPSSGARAAATAARAGSRVSAEDDDEDEYDEDDDEDEYDEDDEEDHADESSYHNSKADGAAWSWEEGSRP